MTRLAALPELPRTGIVEWLEEVTGPVGHLVLGTVASGAGHDAIALGLKLARAIGRLEQETRMGGAGG